jgi:hypothetical protein
MYEMEGPRLVARRRPADCSASIAPLDRLPGPEPNRCSGCPDHQRLRNPRAGWLRVFSFADGPGLPPCRQRRVPLCRVAQSAASGQRPGAFPFAGWLGVSSYQWPEVAPCRGSRSPQTQGARGIPLPVAPGHPKPKGPRYPVAGVVPGLPAPVARRCPVPGGPGLPPRRVAESFLFAGGSGSSWDAGPEIPLCRVAPGSPRAKGPRFPFAGWLRVFLWARDPRIPLCRVAPDALRP